MNNDKAEAIWWKVQGIDPVTRKLIGTPSLYVKITQNLFATDVDGDIEQAKELIVNKIVSILEEGFAKVKEEIK